MLYQYYCLNNVLQSSSSLAESIVTRTTAATPGPSGWWRRWRSLASWHPSASGFLRVVASCASSQVKMRPPPSPPPPLLARCLNSERLLMLTNQSYTGHSPLHEPPECQTVYLCLRDSPLLLLPLPPVSLAAALCRSPNFGLAERPACH